MRVIRGRVPSLSIIQAFSLENAISGHTVRWTHSLAAWGWTARMWRGRGRLGKSPRKCRHLETHQKITFITSLDGDCDQQSWILVYYRYRVRGKQRGGSCRFFGDWCLTRNDNADASPIKSRQEHLPASSFPTATLFCWSAGLYLL